MVKGETFNLQLFESEAFRHFINVFTNKQSGITKGCEVTQNVQNITISPGYFFILGGLLRETTGTKNEIPTDAGYYKLVYEIDLSKINTKDMFNQGNYKFIKAFGDYPLLTQEDLDNDGTIYQLPFAQFRITELGLQDFKDIRPIIDYGIYERKGTTLYENETGTTGNITLNDSIENYKRIKVYGYFYHTNKAKFCKEFLVEANSQIDLTGVSYNGGSYTYLNTETATMSGTSITRGTQYENRLGAGGTDNLRDSGQTVFITKVVGYKE